MFVEDAEIHRLTSYDTAIAAESHCYISAGLLSGHQDSARSRAYGTANRHPALRIETLKPWLRFRAQILIRKLSAIFGVLDISGWVLLYARDHPRPVQHTPGVSRCCGGAFMCQARSSVMGRDLVPCMRANCTRRIPPTKLGLILHNLAHQLSEEVLTGHATLTVS